MNVKLQLPDDLADFYQQEADARGGISLERVLEERLLRAPLLDPRGRYLIVEGRNRERLETKLGGGHLQSAEDLVEKVFRLARVRFGDHEIKLTPGQMEELTHRATKRGKSIDGLLTEIWSKMQAEFFNYVK